MVNEMRTAFEYILSRLFPVKLPSIKLERAPQGRRWDAFEGPVTECGILWRAYDVRRTGIEKQNA
jgi:hypothetical protein